MLITCGLDSRPVNITLPKVPTKIGIFVSGGLDSAILYYLLLKANLEVGNIHQIIPFTIARTEGSKYFARPVIAHVNSQFNIPFKEPTVVGDPSLPGHLQVASGGTSALHMGCTLLYGGVIEQLPEHREGIAAPIEENETIRLPFAHIRKSHIIDLIIKFKQEALFYLTHSCSEMEIGRCNDCPGCDERTWGFTQLGLTDPSII